MGFSVYAFAFDILFHFLFQCFSLINLVTTVYQGVEFKDEAKTEIRPLPVSFTFKHCQYSVKYKARSPQY